MSRAQSKSAPAGRRGEGSVRFPMTSALRPMATTSGWTRRLNEAERGTRHDVSADVAGRGPPEVQRREPAGGLQSRGTLSAADEPGAGSGEGEGRGRGARVCRSVSTSALTSSSLRAPRSSRQSGDRRRERCTSALTWTVGCATATLAPNGRSRATAPGSPPNSRLTATRQPIPASQARTIARRSRRRGSIAERWSPARAGDAPPVLQPHSAVAPDVSRVPAPDAEQRQRVRSAGDSGGGVASRRHARGGGELPRVTSALRSLTLRREGWLQDGHRPLPLHATGDRRWMTNGGHMPVARPGDRETPHRATPRDRMARGSVGAMKDCAGMRRLRHRTTSSHRQVWRDPHQP